jgi:hypothetical protein
MGAEIGVGSTVAVTAPICFRQGVGAVAACGAPWLATMWSTEWRYADCHACLARAPEAARLAREATLRAL